VVELAASQAGLTRLVVVLVEAEPEARVTRIQRWLEAVYHAATVTLWAQDRYDVPVDVLLARFVDETTWPRKEQWQLAWQAGDADALGMWCTAAGVSGRRI
jgi:hypothetical protein